MKEIAVIIPVYKAYETIETTLHSVAMQRHVDYNCYLIVDGEEQGSYDYLLDKFDVNITYLEKNVGPGVARQYGIDHSTEPYISFIDADDTYLSSLALYTQKEPFKNENNVVVVTRFLQEFKDHTTRLKSVDMVWMHGKMYRRSYLEKYDIQFNETRANEDTGFNTQCLCYSNDKEMVHIQEQGTYIWHYVETSIVNSNNGSFHLGDGVIGLVDNLEYAIQRVLKTKQINEVMKDIILNGMINLYSFYIEATQKSPKQIKYISNCAKRYYDNIYKLLDKEFIERNGIATFRRIGYKDTKEYNKYSRWIDKL